MRIRLFVLVSLGAAALAGCPAPESEPPGEPAAGESSGSQPAARVNGEDISFDELDAFIKEELFSRSTRSPQDLYELRSSYLSQLVEKRSFEAEARRRGVSPDELVDQKVAELGEVGEEEIAEFYKENLKQLGGTPLDAVRDRIGEFLSARRASEARDAIREGAEIEIFLDRPRVEVTATGPARGPENAPITIVEFSDFQCPYCRRALPTLEQVFERYPDQVRLVYRHYPLRSHSRARPAAVAALCAEEQGEFWSYHDALFENNKELDDADLRRYAEELGMDPKRFETCLGDARMAQRVEEDLQAGQAAGVSGTPAFFVNGLMISGAERADVFYKLIDGELARLGAGTPGG